MRRAGLILASCCALLSACQGAAEGDISADGYTISEGTLLVVACSSCHLGESQTGAMLSLSGWSEDDMRASLLAYKTEDGSTVMHRLMRGYSDAEIDLMSEILGQQND